MQTIVEKQGLQAHPRSFFSSKQGGFTLVELLLSMTILAILLVMVSTVLADVQGAWRKASTKVSQFRESRRAFDRICLTLSQAMLNNYVVYQYPGSADPLVPPSKNMRQAPSGYLRYSELQFVCGPSFFGGSATQSKLTGLAQDVSPGHAIFFQAPLGRSSAQRLPSGMNGSGFYIMFSGDGATRPDFLTGKGVPQKFRYRLYEYLPNLETNSIYAQSVYDTAAPAARGAWYSDFATQSRPIANNIVMLVFSPATSANQAGTVKPTDIAPNYYYDSFPPSITATTQQGSDFQLPPLVNVTLVAIDEASAENLALLRGDANPTLASELKPALFTVADNYRADIRELEQSLVQSKVNFRIFTATIPIRASRWGQGT